MAKVPEKTDENLRPSLSDRAKVVQISNAALNLLHKRVLDGTATSQELVKAVSLSSEYEKNELEKETIRKQQVLLDAKVGEIQSRNHSEELYEKAIHAFRHYSGDDDDVEGDDFNG